MGHRGILAVLLVGAPALALIAAPAVAQAPVPRRGGRSSNCSNCCLVSSCGRRACRPRRRNSQGSPSGRLRRSSTWDRAYTMALVRRARAACRPRSRSTRRPSPSSPGGMRSPTSAGSARNSWPVRAGSGGAFRRPEPRVFRDVEPGPGRRGARGYVAILENLSKLLQELNRAESTGLSQLNIDLMAEVLLQAGRAASRELIEFRDRLDELKVALGLSTHAAVIPDRRALAAFRDVFNAVEAWATRPDRRLDELPRIVGRLPAAGDAIVEGRPILDPIEQDPTRLEDLLEDAVRTAIKNRGGADKDRVPEDRDARCAASPPPRPAPGRHASRLRGREAELCAGRPHEGP